ncbi:hypothetical protein [Actinoplanes sp. NPDC049316]|uniref:hypothetical protein n=1 Tax=Actinoplanes sp. NPDC049316 TaxID=3154727 RepID=UPI003422217E
MMAVEFSADHEWWVQNRVFAKIMAVMPDSSEQERTVKHRIAQGASIGYLDVRQLPDDLRTDVRSALVNAVSRLIEALEQTTRDAEAEDVLQHFRVLRAIAVAGS